ncbi:BglG family transcription antiterminator LicT [Gracilibacillus alcaliphilus]|uniref:BglG family transcription antiterminator LicT n=1 Tax=Gracilibacillus alcaliphilus TaxID=1401441 RepID=UPI001958B0A5|nr:PRD domain-containing protein [Gracilibacillus alcaliphilus]MBM7675542.1 beta-glucoside operon transcriptional antiterminator [Gracilibacillus alcaliphilus]
MIIKKVLNNNVVMTENHQGQEVVVMGKGLAFQKKAGQVIEEDKIEKIFKLEDQTIYDKLIELLKDTPEKYLELADKVLQYATSQLPYKLDEYLYIALTDHLHFAISRYKQGIELKNALHWEIRKYYKEEYRVALHALDIIEEEANVRFAEDEAASIALHLVNSQLSDGHIDETIQITKMVNNILTIVRYHYQVPLDEDSVSYDRFLTHLRFFALRYVRKEVAEGQQTDDFLLEQVKSKYQEAYRCSEKVAKYVEKDFNWVIGDDEKIYLTLHIHRVTQRLQ